MIRKTGNIKPVLLTPSQIATRFQNIANAGSSGSSSTTENQLKQKFNILSKSITYTIDNVKVLPLTNSRIKYFLFSGRMKVHSGVVKVSVKDVNNITSEEMQEILTPIGFTIAVSSSGSAGSSGNQ